MLISNLAAPYTAVRPNLSPWLYSTEPYCSESYLNFSFRAYRFDVSSFIPYRTVFNFKHRFPFILSSHREPHRSKTKSKSVFPFSILIANRTVPKSNYKSTKKNFLVHPDPTKVGSLRGFDEGQKVIFFKFFAGDTNFFVFYIFIQINSLK